MNGFIAGTSRAGLQDVADLSKCKPAYEDPAHRKIEVPHRRTAAAIGFAHRAVSSASSI